MNVKTVVPLGAAVVLGLVAAIVARQLIAQGPSPTINGVPSDVSLSDIVVAAHDIAPGATLGEADLTVARVERCLTRYSCSWITPIPPRILLKQGTTYDYVSGATESSDAFQDAVSEALSQAK